MNSPAHMLKHDHALKRSMIRQSHSGITMLNSKNRQSLLKRSSMVLPQNYHHSITTETFNNYSSNGHQTHVYTGPSSVRSPKNMASSYAQQSCQQRPQNYPYLGSQSYRHSNGSKHDFFDNLKERNENVISNTGIPKNSSNYNSVNKYDIGNRINSVSYTTNDYSKIQREQLKLPSYTPYQNDRNSISSNQNRYASGKNMTEPFESSNLSCLEEKIKMITDRLQNTILRVQKHQASLIEIRQKQSKSQKFPLVQLESLKTNLTKIANKEAEQSKTAERYKEQIQSLRRQIQQSYPNKQNIQKQLKNMQSGISGAIANINKSLCQELSNLSAKSKKQIKSDSQQMKTQLNSELQKIRIQLQASIKKWRQEYEKNQKATQGSENQNSFSLQLIPIQSSSSIKENSSSSNNIFSTRKASKSFLGNPILLKISHHAVAIKSDDLSKQVKLQDQQLIYRVDPQGYLLDSENHYLVNSKDEQIRLRPEQMEILKQKGVLH